MSREVNVKDIKDKVRELFVKANTVLRPDVLSGLEKLYEKEKIENAKNMIGILVENARVAKDKKLPLCQDTGMSVVFLDVGSEVVLTGGDLTEAVDQGVEAAYSEGFFRKSVVSDPILRHNTGANTPAILHTEIVKGDKIKVSVMPKGFGSENKGKIAMLNPTSSTNDIIDFCVGAVEAAGPDACPPYVLGIGMGGTMETCAFLAKKALLRPLDSENSQQHLAVLEKTIEKRANDLKIGVMGLGGISTVMGVNIEAGPTHIAGLPVAINISCHALRSASGEI